MEVKELVRVEWRNEPVLTTAQVAEGLECSTDQIRWIFGGHKEQFEENVHFFNVSGSQLKELKKEVANRYLDSAPLKKGSEKNSSHTTHFALSFGKGAKCLKLWTYQGVARLSKLVDTPKAWELFTALEQNYFKTEPPPAVLPPARKTPSEMACAYVFDMSDDTVKIGHTGDISDRMARMKRERGLDVRQGHHTPQMPRDNARRIERTMHKKFAHVKVKGEFFNADFAEVSTELDRLASVEADYYEEEITCEFSDYDRVSLAIDLINVSPENCKERLTHAAANLLFGRQIF